MNLYDVINKIAYDNGGIRYTYFAESYLALLDCEKDKETYCLLKKVISLIIKEENKNFIVYPAYELADGTAFFRLDDISEADYITIKNIAMEKLPFDMAVKLNMILWVGANDYRAANEAAEMYISKFQTINGVEDWVEAYNSIKSAVVLLAKIGKKEELTKCLNLAFDTVIKLNGDDDSFLSIKLMYLLFTQKTSQNFSLLLPIIDKLIASGNEYKLEELYKLKAKCYRLLGEESKAKEARIEYAKHLEEVADNGDSVLGHIFRTIDWYKKAIVEYRDNGMPDEAKRVQKKLANAEKQVLKNMHCFKRSVDVSDIVKRANVSYKELDFKESVIQLARHVQFRTLDQIKTDVLESSADCFSASLFTNAILDDKGRTIAKLPPLDNNPENDEELLRLHMHFNERRFEEQYGNLILKYQLSLFQKMDFSIEDLDFLCKNNLIVPSNRASIVAQGLYWGLKGNLYLAIHVLAPQAENIFRVIAEECGDITSSIDYDGKESATISTSIFELPMLNECYKDNLLFIFRGMLMERVGANFRNDVAHGLLEENRAKGGNGIFFFCAILHLIFLYSNEAFMILKNSKKIKRNDQYAEKIHVAN